MHGNLEGGNADGGGGGGGGGMERETTHMSEVA